MATFAVDDYVTQVGTPEQVAALLETRIELVNSSSGLHLITVVPVGDGSKCYGIVIHDAI